MLRMWIVVDKLALTGRTVCCRLWRLVLPLGLQAVQVMQGRARENLSNAPSSLGYLIGCWLQE